MLTSVPCDTPQEGIMEEAGQMEKVWRTRHLSSLWREASYQRDTNAACNASPRLPLLSETDRGARTEGPYQMVQTWRLLYRHSCVHFVSFFSLSG